MTTTYKCYYLNKHFRNGTINSSPSVDAIIKMDDKIGEWRIICPLYNKEECDETGNKCIVKKGFKQQYIANYITYLILNSNILLFIFHFFYF